MKNLTPVSEFTSPVRAPEPVVDLRKAITVEEGLQALLNRTEYLKDTKVTGPASATNNAVARFDEATGKLVQNSVVTLSDGGSFAGVAGIAMTDEITGPTRITLDVGGDILLGAGAPFTKYLGPAAFHACFHSGGTTPNVGIGPLGEVTLESNSNAAVYLDLNEHVPDGAEITAIYVIVNPGNARAGTNRMRVDRHTRTIAIGSPPTIGSNSIVSEYDDTTTNLQQIAMTGLTININKAGGVLNHITVHSGNTAATNADKVYGVAIIGTQYEITGR